MEEYTVKIVFNDGGTLLIECDKFITNDAGYFKVMRGGQLINVIPFVSVKYTKLSYQMPVIMQVEKPITDISLLEFSR